MKSGTFKALYVPKDFDPGKDGWCDLGQAVMEWIHAYEGLPVLFENILPLLGAKDTEGFHGLEAVQTQMRRALLDMKDIMIRYHKRLDKPGCDITDCPCHIK